MKRLLCLLVALFLPVTALAETVAERVHAPETWQGEFQSNTGKTHVYVDMTVEVPEVEAIPIWAVNPYTFTVEQVVQAADLCLGEGNWYQIDTYGDQKTPLEGEPRFLRTDFDVWTDYDLSLRNDDGHWVYSSYDYVQGMGEWHQTNYIRYTDFRTDHTPDIGTLEDAIALADSYVAQLDPDMVYESVNPRTDGFMMRVDTRGRSSHGYRLYYARKVSGIMVTPYLGYGADDAKETFNPVPQCEELWVDVGDEGVFALEWSHPIELTDMISEDCELLTFDQIIDILGTISPLTIQRYEYEPNNNLYINRAVLGYMCLQERGNPTSYQLLPVWDFFGVRTIGGERYDNHNVPLLTINAIDGTIIDRMLGY